jgi:hypothetical protein
MEERYVTTDLPRLTLVSTPRELLQSALAKTITTTPLKEKYSSHDLGGLFAGYTGLAYLFLHVSAHDSSLDIHGHDPLFWARQYLDGDRGDLALKWGNCGLASEKLSFEAVRASKDRIHVLDFLSKYVGIA